VAFGHRGSATCRRLMAPFTDHVAIKPDSQTSVDVSMHLNDLNRIHMITSHLPAPNGISHESTSLRAQILLLLNKESQALQDGTAVIQREATGFTHAA